ncbi:MAG: hypothetical protein ACO3A4_03910 [Silvanigrellaceae bacterium]
MTTHSPELLAGTDSRVVQIANQAQTVQVDSHDLLLFSRLDCLSTLKENPTQFFEAFAEAVRNELAASLSSGELLQRLGLWWNFSSFKKTVHEDLDDFRRDVLLGQQVLSNTGINAIFQSDASWTLLQKRAQCAILDSLAGLPDDGDLDGKLQQIFVQQRDAMVKDTVLRFLPTIVLLMSTLIAMVMAILVWRSLSIGH